MKVQFFWHSFFRISFQGASFLVDPFIELPEGENTFKPCMKCPSDASKIKAVDFICISNEQFDHFDRKTVELISRRNRATVVGHESVLNELDIPQNLKHPAMIGDAFSLCDVKIEINNAHYPNSFYPLSYRFSKDGESLFFAGNTDLMDAFSEIKTDVAILPIGGSSTMDVIDAVRATKTMKPKYVIPMHYNSFPTIMADPDDFRSRIEKSILKTIPVVLKPGQDFRTK